MSKLKVITMSAFPPALPMTFEEKLILLPLAFKPETRALATFSPIISANVPLATVDSFRDFFMYPFAPAALPEKISFT